VTTTVAAPAATISVYSPPHLRGGLLYESRITIETMRELKHAELVLDNGWLEGITVNTIEPSPIGEASRNGRLALQLGHIRAGQTYRLFIQSQVNPTNVGRRAQGLELWDGSQHLLTVHRDITVWP
jgi:hypothetical protein